MTDKWTLDQWVSHGLRWVRAGWEWKRWQVALVDVAGRVQPVSITSIDTEFGATFMRVRDARDRLHVVDATECVPDLRDPCTVGHALDQAERAWNALWKNHLVMVSLEPTPSVDAGRAAAEQHVARVYISKDGWSDWRDVWVAGPGAKHSVLLSLREDANDWEPAP